jgi:uncharacterized protein (DUF1810 family)
VLFAFFVANPSPLNLSRFLEAQAPLYATALAELQAGHKRTHWIWFVLPQLRGLGSSHNATYYGIENAAEAAAYLAHPVLGARLRECVAAIMAHKDKSAHAMLGSPDDAKFRSCLTLFREVAAPDDRLWQDALDQFYAGEPDPATLRLLES